MPGGICISSYHGDTNTSVATNESRQYRHQQQNGHDHDHDNGHDHERRLDRSDSGSTTKKTLLWNPNIFKTIPKTMRNQPPHIQLKYLTTSATRNINYLFNPQTKYTSKCVLYIQYCLFHMNLNEYESKSRPWRKRILYWSLSLFMFMEKFV
mmetsp:Transcript_6534/g.11819  ORF Transcript_6534/g.11819 Transcript_6534/m.11819 type:complete len:152 (-) Transcript_6534:262-717(-)